MNIIHLFADEAGESHFEPLDVKTSAVDFAPPAPQVNISAATEVARQLFLVLPAAWYGAMHPAPSRQYMTIVAGSLEVTASDGEVRTFHAGDTALVEDTQGKGHATKNVGDGETVLSVVQL